MLESQEPYDSIIIGTGPAGISAGIYTGRAKLKTLIIGKPEEGHLYKAHIIENYFGFLTGSGAELMEIGIKQAQNFGCEFLRGEVTNAVKENEIFKVRVDNGKEYFGKSLIITTGTAYKQSGLKNEKELSGKGVHYCGVCDGYFYKNKKIAVIGNANHAADEAITLLSYSKDITIFSNGKKFDTSQALMDYLKKNNVKLSEEKVISLEGKSQLESLVFENGKRLKFDGVFMALGITTALSFSTKLGLAIEKNYLIIDRDGKTNIPGVFAAGNCTGGNSQAAVSVGEGCNAAISVIKFLKGVSVYIDYS